MHCACLSVYVTDAVSLTLFRLLMLMATLSMMTRFSFELPVQTIALNRKDDIVKQMLGLPATGSH